MTRYEYTVTVRHHRTKEKRQHVCWGDNMRDAIDHARMVLNCFSPVWTAKAERTGNRAPCVA